MLFSWKILCLQPLCTLIGLFPRHRSRGWRLCKCCNLSEVRQSKSFFFFFFHGSDVLFTRHISREATEIVIIDFSHRNVSQPWCSNDPVKYITHKSFSKRSDLISLSAQLLGKEPISAGEGRDTARGMVGVCGTPSLCGIHCCPSVGHYFPPWGCRTLKPSGSLLLPISEMLHIAFLLPVCSADHD